MTNTEILNLQRLNNFPHLSIRKYRSIGMGEYPGISGIMELVKKMQEKPELYMCHTFDETTLKGHKKQFSDKKKAIAYYNWHVKATKPIIVHELIGTNAAFNSWQVMKDETGKEYHYGNWKPYFQTV